MRLVMRWDQGHLCQKWHRKRDPVPERQWPLAENGGDKLLMLLVQPQPQARVHLHTAHIQRLAGVATFSRKVVRDDPGWLLQLNMSTRRSIGGITGTRWWNTPIETCLGPVEIERLPIFTPRLDEAYLRVLRVWMRVVATTSSMSAGIGRVNVGGGREHLRAPR